MHIVQYEKRFKSNNPRNKTSTSQFSFTWRSEDNIGDDGVLLSACCEELPVGTAGSVSVGSFSTYNIWEKVYILVCTF